MYKRYSKRNRKTKKYKQSKIARGKSSPSPVAPVHVSPPAAFPVATHISSLDPRSPAHSGAIISTLIPRSRSSVRGPPDRQTAARTLKNFMFQKKT